MKIYFHYDKIELVKGHQNNSQTPKNLSHPFWNSWIRCWEYTQQRLEPFKLKELFIVMQIYKFFNLRQFKVMWFFHKIYTSGFGISLS